MTEEIVTVADVQEEPRTVVFEEALEAILFAAWRQMRKNRRGILALGASIQERNRAPFLLS